MHQEVDDIVKYARLKRRGMKASEEIITRRDQDGRNKISELLRRNSLMKHTLLTEKRKTNEMRKIEATEKQPLTKQTK